MNALQRQLALSIGLACLSTVITGLLIFLVYPLPDWSHLWTTELFGFPFILVVPGISMGIGISFGLIYGLFWQRQFQTIEGVLHELEQGRRIEVQPGSGVQEVDRIGARIEKLQQQMGEQVKVARRMVIEKAEDQEKRMQEIVSQERHRLARELHDSVSQQLFAASMLMSAIAETSSARNERETKQLRMVETMIHQSQLEMRALLLHLRPFALAGKSLQEGMEELLVELSQKVPLTIEWKIEPMQLDKGIEDHLFRILQEAVSNTLRHAKASRLDVLLIERDNLIIMRIVDDGVGFDVESAKAGSYGLQNMRERAMELGGYSKIISLPGQGTSLEVRIPRMMTGGESDD